MQKHIIPVLTSFFSVILIILLGTNIAYRTNVIPELENIIQKGNEEAIRREEDQNKRIETLENELNIAQEKQYEAEEKLKEKLAEEEKIALEKAQAEQAARLAAADAAAKAAADKAAADAAAKSSSSKKSKAS